MPSYPTVLQDAYVRELRGIWEALIRAQQFKCCNPFFMNTDILNMEKKIQFLASQLNSLDQQPEEKKQPDGLVDARHRPDESWNSERRSLCPPPPLNYVEDEMYSYSEPRPEAPRPVRLDDINPCSEKQFSFGQGSVDHDSFEQESGVRGFKQTYNFSTTEQLQKPWSQESSNPKRHNHRRERKNRWDAKPGSREI